MPVTDVVWNWANALPDDAMEDLLRFISDDVDHLPAEYRQALLWEAANRFSIGNRG